MKGLDEGPVRADRLIIGPSSETLNKKTVPAPQRANYYQAVFTSLLKADSA
jgi:hypothetical protein